MLHRLTILSPIQLSNLNKGKNKVYAFRKSEILFYLPLQNSSYLNFIFVAFLSLKLTIKNLVVSPRNRLSEGHWV